MIKLQILLFSIMTILLTACGSSDEDATRIVLGRGNTIEELNELQYQLAFSVQVTDEDSNAAPNTRVTLKVRNLEYYKGRYIAAGEGWVASYSAECTAEDINNNGELESGEDINGNGQLDPTNPVTITAHSSETPTIDPITKSILTDEDGFGYFSLTYPKSEALWVRIRLTATAEVSGTEEDEVFEQTLSVLIADVDDTGVSPPGGTSSKYGIAADCSDPN